MKALSSILGVKNPSPQPDELHAALTTAVSTDPALLSKLSQAQVDFQAEQMRLEFADMANARDRQVQHEKATGKSDVNLYMLAWLFVAGFFVSYIVLLILIFTNHFPATIPPAAIYLMGTLNGTLTAGVGAVVQYFFGKTKDTAAHVDMLANSIPMDQLGKILGCANGGTKY